MTEQVAIPADQIKPPEPNSVAEIIQGEMQLLRTEGQRLIGSIKPAPEDAAFRTDLDNPKHHQPTWHEWGIITHTEKVLEMVDTEAARYIKDWGMTATLDEYMNQKVDPESRFTKWDLFRMSIPFHDVGKFASPMSENVPGSRNHSGHEVISGREVWDRSGAYWKYLSSMGVADTEIEYIGLLAEKHFELGKIRNQALKTAEGYSLAFATGRNFADAAKPILQTNADIAIEVGLWFLVDSLAKTDMVIDAYSDQEIAEQKVLAGNLIQQKLDAGEIKDARLIQAVLQRPVNIVVAREFLTNHS